MVMMIDDMDSSGRLRKRNAGTHLHVNEQLRIDLIWLRTLLMYLRVRASDVTAL